MISPTICSESNGIIVFSDMMDEEKWLPVPGFENEYEISSWGRVLTKAIGGRRPKNGLMKLTENHKGYLTVGFSVSRKKQIRRFVHRLVAESFIPNPNHYPQVNHKDGNKKNNNVENLEWVDNRRNQLHAIEIGLKVDNKPILQYDLQGNFIKEWISMSEAARNVGVSVAHICDCVNGKRKKSANSIWKLK